YLWSGSIDSTLKGWNEQGQCIFTLPVDYSVRSMTVWSQLLCCGTYYPYLIILWDLDKDMKCVNTLRGHENVVTSLRVWNNDLYSGSDDNTIRRWNLQGECIAVLKGHNDSVQCLEVWNEG